LNPLILQFHKSIYSLLLRAAKELTDTCYEENRKDKPHIRSILRFAALFPFFKIPDYVKFPNNLPGFQIYSRCIGGNIIAEEFKALLYSNRPS